MDDAGEMIDMVSRNNLLLVPLDAQHNWYRYHQIFCDAVRERIRICSPERLSRIYRQAPAVLEKGGHK